MDHGNVTGQGLTSIVSRARTLAAQNEYPVGVRELFLALLANDPRGVIRSWQARGLDGARLIEAVREWWPAADSRGMLPGSAQLSDEAGAALEWVTTKAGQVNTSEALLQHLLDTRVSLLVSPLNGGSPEANADHTAIVLSQLGLV